tara:strand:- start:50 stop:283 length:234 start_codon:yes stop_codon:yes gene_type:complete
MSKELENFKAIAVGGGSKMGLIVSPITINSHIRRKTNPNKDGTINLDKLKVSNLEILTLSHHPPNHTIKNMSKYIFI